MALSHGTQPNIIKRHMVIVREIRGGKEKFSFRPYDIVEVYYRDDQPARTFLQPHGYQPKSNSEDEVIYDSVRIYNEYPAFDLQQPGARPKLVA